MPCRISDASLLRRLKRATFKGVQLELEWYRSKQLNVIKGRDPAAGDKLNVNGLQRKAATRQDGDRWTLLGYDLLQTRSWYLLLGAIVAVHSLQVLAMFTINPSGFSGIAPCPIIPYAREVTLLVVLFYAVLLARISVQLR